MGDAATKALIDKWWGLRFTVAFGDPQGWVFDRPELTLAMRRETLAEFKKATEAVAALCFANDSRADGRRLLEIVLPSEIISDTLQATISYGQHDELEIIVKTLQMVTAPPAESPPSIGEQAKELTESANPLTHFASDIRKELDVTDTTFRKYVIAAGVRIGKPGERGLRYSDAERRAILTHVRDAAPAASTSARAVKALGQPKE